MTDFGSDVSTFPDLDLSFAPLTGPRVVAEAIARRLSTPTGSLPFEPGYGIDVRGWVNETQRPGSPNRLARVVENQSLQEERVTDATAQIVFDAASSSLSLQITLVTADGPFALVLQVTALSVNLLSVG